MVHKKKFLKVRMGSLIETYLVKKLFITHSNQFIKKTKINFFKVFNRTIKDSKFS